MGVHLREQQRSEDTLKGADMESIVVIVRRRLAWFGRVNRRDTEDIRTAMETKVE